MEADFTEFAEFADRLRTLAQTELAVPVAEGAGEVWIVVTLRRIPRDTEQSANRTQIVYVGGTATQAKCELMIDTPYIGYQEFGTRYIAPRYFWRAGRDAAVDAANAAGVPLRTQVRRGLNSGGVMNPRQLIRAPI